MEISIRAKLSHVKGEIVLSAADSNLIGRNLRDGILHLEVKESFYGEINVTEEFLRESMAICTIGNFVGKKTIRIAVEMGVVDPDNIIKIEGVPHGQYAKMIR